MATTALNGINIAIGGTSTGLTNAVNSAVNSLNSLAPASSAAAAGITNLNAAVRSGQATFVTLNNTLANTATNAQHTGQQVGRLGSSLASLPSPSARAATSLTDVSRIVQDMPFGFIAIQNNISPLIESFGRLSTTTGGFFGAIRALGGALLGPAGLGFAVAAITSGLTYYFQAQQRAASAAKQAADQIGTLAETNKKFDVSVQNSTASAAAEGTTLLRLFHIAQDDTRARNDRVAALKELQKQTNGYLKDLTLETVKTAEARKALDEFNASLFNSALLKAYQGKVSDLAKAWAENADAAEKGRKKVAEIDAQIAKTRALPTDFDASLGRTETRLDRLAKLAQERSKEVAATNVFIKEQNKLQEDILATGTKIADLQVKVNPFTKAENTTKSVTTVADVLADLNLEIEKTNALFANSGDTLQELTSKHIQAYTNALRSLIDINVKPGDKLFDQLKERLDALNSVAAGRPQNIKLPVTVTPEPKVTPSNNMAIVFNETTKQWQTAFEKAVDGFNPNLDNFSFKLQGQLETLFHSGFADIGAGLAQAVGDIVTGAKPLSAALNGLVGMVADFAISFGKALIAAGTATLAAKVLIKNPVTAIAAGLLAIAAGTIIRNAVANAPSFAQGGIVTEPTYARIGDNPGRKEAVIPSELWPLLGSGGSQVIIPDARISGQDIVIAYNRSVRNENRIR